MSEEWRDIPGYNGHYKVSDMGRVRSTDRYKQTANGQVRFYHSRVLKPGRKKSGHVSVALGKGNSVDVHRLVLLSFIGPCPEGHEALHGNHTPDDNRLENLRWGTRSENVKADFEAGTRKTHPNFNRWGYVYV